jgi:Poly(R)-hydroxyalkanoic acid synthase subunit (PHA_synth_III_E)
MSEEQNRNPMGSTQGREQHQSGPSHGQDFDPASMMINFYDTWAKTWSKAVSEAISSQSFAESMGQQLEGSLDTMALMRRQADEFMEQYLRQVSLPSRKEVTSLAERLTHIEMELDDLGARMDEILDLLKAAQKTPGSRKKQGSG